MSITQKSKKKLIKGSVIVVVLLFLFTLSKDWRDARLDKRAQMLPKAVYVSLGKTGSSATTEFLVDSADGLQSFMVSIETLDELTRDQIDPSTTFPGKTLKVDVLYKYRHINSAKYRDWKDIKLVYEVKEKNTGKRIIQYEYNPYDVNDYSDIKRVVPGTVLKNGQYVASFKIINGHPDFLPYQTKVHFFHPAHSGDWADFWSEGLDQILFELKW